MADFQTSVGGNDIIVTVSDSLATVIQSTGAGSSIISSTVDSTTTLKSLVAGSGVTITDNGTDLTFTAGGLGAITTDDVTEGTNLYFTEQRVDDAIADSVVTASLQLTGGVGTQGLITWNADEETLDLIQNGATLQLGQETQVHARNNTFAPIPDGTPVMATGTLGASGRITIAPMDGTNPLNAKYFLGVTTEPIGVGEDGKVTSFGKVRNIDTSMWNPGDVLYVSPTVAGGFVNVEPTAPDIAMPVAFVIHNATNGTLMIRSTNVDEHKFAHYSHTHSINDVTDFTNNSANWDTAYGWGDHSLAGYLTSYTETDPVFSASPSAGITALNITNWNTAYSWGDHNAAGYLTSYSETDPIFTASAASGITVGNISNWNTAYGWGDHSAAGYATTTSLTNQNIVDHADYLSIQPLGDGQVLAYSTAAGNKWVNFTVSTDAVPEGSNLYFTEARANNRNLDDFNDVTYLNIGQDDILIRNATGEWQNLNPVVHYGLATTTDVSNAVASQNITDHADYLSIQPEGDGQILGYSVAAGNKWVNVTPSANDLSDVDLTTTPPVQDDVLVYNGVTNTWEPSGIVGDIDTALTAILGA